MTFSFRAYIDESGDEGFVFYPDGSGSSRWFILSAVVVRDRNDQLLREKIGETRTQLGKQPKANLHFRELIHEHRLPYLRNIVSLPLLTVSVLVNKVALPAPEEYQSSKHLLYRYVSKIVLERVSWICRDYAVAGEGNGQIDLVFSNRSQMSYEDLRDYLQLLKSRHPDPDCRIEWPTIDPETVRTEKHEAMAGLQIADAVASGLMAAVQRNRFGDLEPRYLAILKPKAYKHKAKAIGYGFKFWPYITEMLPANPHLSEFAG